MNDNWCFKLEPGDQVMIERFQYNLRQNFTLTKVKRLTKKQIVVELYNWHFWKGTGNEVGSSSNYHSASLKQVTPKNMKYYKIKVAMENIEILKNNIEKECKIVKPKLVKVMIIERILGKALKDIKLTLS